MSEKRVEHTTGDFSCPRCTWLFNISEDELEEDGLVTLHGTEGDPAKVICPRCFYAVKVFEKVVRTYEVAEWNPGKVNNKWYD